MQKCRQEDSVLVDVSSNEENVYLQHRHNGAKSWLGLNDRTIEGNFTWVDRGQGNFTAWAKNQPNNFRGEDCVVLYVTDVTFRLYGAHSRIKCTDNE